MKTTIKTIVTCALALILIISIGIAVVYLCPFANPKEKQYPAAGVVTEVNYNTDTVTIQDFNGNLWNFCGCEDWAPNDICAMLMNDNGTPETIFDDIIIMVRYCGYFE